MYFPSDCFILRLLVLSYGFVTIKFKKQKSHLPRFDFCFHQNIAYAISILMVAIKTQNYNHISQDFYNKFLFEKFRGKYYPIAYDGSEFNISGNPNATDTFYEPNRTAKSSFNMIHTVSLYELSAKRYLDMEVQSGHFKNEFQALCSLMDRYAHGEYLVFIADREFSSYNVFAYAIENQ